MPTGRTTVKRPLIVVAATVAVALVVAVIVLVVQQGQAGPASLTNHTWTLTQLVVEGHELPLSDAKPITLSFKSQDHGFSGSSGCNSYGGSYSITGSQIHFSAIRSTLKLCADAGVMEREAAYLLALPRVESFRIDGSTLTLEGDNGAVHMTFRA
jgi:heat shock protein HslJ